MLTYEQSVKWLRTQPEYEEIIRLCYFDENNYEASRRFAQSEEFSEIIKLLKLNKSTQPLKILDLGCGNGIASYAFASLGNNVYAVDPDPSDDVGLGATEKLSSKLEHGSISISKSFAENLPFPDDSFDIVYARQSLHHFYNLGLGLKEVYRVLKPNGTFLATREHVVSDEQQLKKFLEDHLLHKFHGGENAYPLRVYETLLKNAGFNIKILLKPYDTVINHFPISNSELRQRFNKILKRRFGTFYGKNIDKIPGTFYLYRKLLSYGSNEPGRLYSFLSTKK